MQFVFVLDTNLTSQVILGLGLGLSLQRSQRGIGNSTEVSLSSDFVVGVQDGARDFSERSLERRWRKTRNHYLEQVGPAVTDLTGLW
jgi:hypothetical protein